MSKNCEFKESIAAPYCGAPSAWIADVRWPRESEGPSEPAYRGTSWSMSLCQPHFESLQAAGRITGTPHRAV